MMAKQPCINSQETTQRDKPMGKDSKYLLDSMGADSVMNSLLRYASAGSGDPRM